MNKIQFKPKRKKIYRNILHYSVYIVKPFHPSFAVVCLDTLKQVLDFLDISKLNYAKHKFIKAVNFNKKQLRNFYKTYDRIYDINLRQTIHIENFNNFLKPFHNLNKEFVIVTKTYFTHYNNKK